MKWTVPQRGDNKTVFKFLFLPVEAYNVKDSQLEIRWLCWATVLLKYSNCFPFDRWVNWQFLD